MGDLVSDGTSFSCPFCTGKPKLTVISSSGEGNCKKLANTSNFIFPPPPGAQCTLIPTAPVPCTPAVNVIDPGQQPVTINGSPALGTGCKLMCAKGGMLTISSSGQSIAQHDGASAGEKALLILDILLSLIPAFRGIKILKNAAKAVRVLRKLIPKKPPKAAPPAKSAPPPAPKPPQNPPKAANDNKGPAPEKPLPKSPAEPKKKSATQQKIDAQKEHLNYSDLNAAKRESKGEVVKLRDDGKPFDHQHEVRDAQQGLKKQIVKLKEQLKNNPSPVEKVRMEKELSEASRWLDSSETFVESAPFKAKSP